MQEIKTMELVKRYKNLTAVDNLNLEIKQGELFSLLGVNGAGKTTTIKMLTCLTRPSGGDAFVGGYSVTKQPEEVKQLIGVSPQETAVAPNLSVKENLELICGIHGFSKEKTKSRIEELDRQFALDSVLKRKAGKLSGGFQRRVSIAMALISEPKILFLDEPTLGLDVIARHDLWDVIRSLKGEITIILTTHYMEEAEALSDRIGIMKSGRLLAVGTGEELKEKAGSDDFESAFVSIVKETSGVKENVTRKETKGEKEGEV
jgi:ABC-2 type transport system ATP-binding protein